jgi:periplasmic copper chaperone A
MSEHVVHTIFVIGAGLIALPPAAAHVTLEAQQAPAHSYFKAVFRVPHGCAASPTVRLRIRMPEGVTAVKPQPKPGWKLDTTRIDVVPPADDGHGGKITEKVSEVTWSEGRLPDQQFDEFAILMRLPDSSGETLYFPVIQECEKGVSRWIEIPAAGKAAGREPAPALRLTPGK